MRATLLLLLLPLVAAATPADTIKLYFDIGVPALSATAMQQVDSLMYNDVLLPNKKLAIIGYADYLGSEKANITLSENRANNVRNYLVGMGIRQEDIQMVMGKGEVGRTVLNGDAGYQEDRRVDIIPGGLPEATQPPPARPAPPAIDISTVKKNQSITLDKLFFLPGSHKLRDESYPQLKALYQTMAENPTLKIQIEGHICCLLQGTTDGYDFDKEDFNLSRNRAQFVYDYLVRRGIASERMRYVGYGKLRPLVIPEKTVDDENRNRRVEIRILEK